MASARWKLATATGECDARGAGGGIVEGSGMLSLEDPAMEGAAGSGVEEGQAVLLDTELEATTGTSGGVLNAVTAACAGGASTCPVGPW